jgi:hypothetical protein
MPLCRARHVMPIAREPPSECVVTTRMLIADKQLNPSDKSLCHIGIVVIDLSLTGSVYHLLHLLFTFLYSSYIVYNLLLVLLVVIRCN